MPKRRRFTRQRDRSVCKSCTPNVESPRSSEYVRRATRHTHGNSGNLRGFMAHTSAHRRKATRPTGQTTAETAKSRRQTAHTTALTSNSHPLMVHPTAPTAKSRGPTAHSTAQMANLCAPTLLMTMLTAKTHGQIVTTTSHQVTLGGIGSKGPKRKTSLPVRIGNRVELNVAVSCGSPIKMSANPARQVRLRRVPASMPAVRRGRYAETDRTSTVLRRTRRKARRPPADDPQTSNSHRPPVHRLLSQRNRVAQRRTRPLKSEPVCSNATDDDADSENLIRIFGIMKPLMPYSLVGFSRP